MNKKGSFDLYIYFFISVVIIMLFGYFFIPFLIKLNSESLVFSEKITNSSINTISQIQDANVKESLINALEETKTYNVASTENLNFFYKYSWLLIIIITAVILYIISREKSEMSYVQ